MPETADQELVFGYDSSPGVDAQALANRQALIDAFGRMARGEEEAFGPVDPDASFHEASCLPYGGSHQGLDAIKRGYREMCATFSQMRSEFHEVLTAAKIASSTRRSPSPSPPTATRAASRWPSCSGSRMAGSSSGARTISTPA